MGEIFFISNRQSSMERPHSNVDFESRKNRSTFLSVFELPDGGDAKGILFHVHGGFYSEFNRYDVLPAWFALADSIRFKVVSPDFGSIREGDSRIDMIADLSRAWKAAMDLFPSLPVVAVGVSSAGYVIQNAVLSGAFQGAAGAILDSPAVCPPRTGEFMSMDSRTCGYEYYRNTWPNIVGILADFPCLSNADLPIPVFVSTASDDRIIAVREYDELRFADAPQGSRQERCVERFGYHGNSLGFSCLPRLGAWLESEIGADLPRLGLTFSMLTNVLLSLSQYATASTRSKRESCDLLCITEFADPVARKVLGCEV